MKVYLFIISSIFILFTACNNNMEDKKSHKEVNAFYNEDHRPQYHFSPKEKWMNDPNGMFFYEGEYHLFYQYYPDSTVWGPMHWGHAISKGSGTLGTFAYCTLSRFFGIYFFRKCRG